MGWALLAVVIVGVDYTTCMNITNFWILEALLLSPDIIKPAIHNSIFKTSTISTNIFGIKQELSPNTGDFYIL